MRSNIESFISDFEKSYGKLRSTRFSSKGSKWEDYLKILEESDEYRDRLIEVHETMTRNQKRPNQEFITEELISRLVDRIAKSIRPSYEQASDTISTDDIGRPLDSPLGGTGYAFVSASDKADPSILRSNIVSQESYDVLSKSIEVLQSLGHDLLAEKVSSILSFLEVV